MRRERMILAVLPTALTLLMLAYVIPVYGWSVLGRMHDRINLLLCVLAVRFAWICGYRGWGLAAIVLLSLIPLLQYGLWLWLLFWGYKRKQSA